MVLYNQIYIVIQADIWAPFLLILNVDNAILIAHFETFPRPGFTAHIRYKSFPI